VDALQRLMPLLALVIAIASIVAAWALWQTADATDERACIEAANAKYPPVGVSAFVSRDRRDTGPIKLSYVTERLRAVNACD
jgi:parvulin-like peptidyl-prolyl isomerase